MTGTAGGKAVSGIDPSRSPTGEERARRRRARHVRRLQPGDRTRLPSRRQAGLVGGAWQPFLAPRGAQGSFPQVLPPASLGLGDCLAEAARARRQRLGYPAAASAAPKAAPAPGSDAALGGRAPKGKAFVDFQNDVTAEDSAARPCARATAMSSTPNATRRTGWRPTRARPSNSTAIGILAEARGASPAEVGTTTFRPFTRRFPSVRSPAPSGRALPADRAARRCTAGPRSRARVRGDRPLAALRLLSARRRDDLAAERRPRGPQAVRAGVGICDVSMLGKIESSAPDAAEFLNRVYLQRLLELAGRPGALWPDAARGRLHLRRRHDQPAGRDALLHDHDHRPGGRVLLAPRILCARRSGRSSTCGWPRRPTSGRRWRWRARRRARRWQDRRGRPRERGLSLSRGPRGDAEGWAQGPAVSHLLLGRARLRAGRAGGLWRERRRRGAGGGASLRDHALRLGDPGRAARREGPRHRMPRSTAR